MVDEYVRYYQYTESPETSRLPHESRVFHPIHKQKITKSDMTPLVMESPNLVVFRGKKWQADLMFDPVMGRYKLRYKGDGQVAHEVFTTLCGIDGSEWSGGLCQCLVHTALADWEEYEPYRRIPGVSYTQAERNKREGPKDGNRFGKDRKPVRTSW